jgi:hypothetical protein
VIRLDEKTSLSIEEAALKSFEEYGDRWKALSRRQILDQIERNLNLLSHFNGLPIERILESEAKTDFAVLCVQLSVCQRILNEGKIPSGGPHRFIQPNDLDELL